MQALTLYDMRDRDLLYTLEEIADQEGYATAQDVAEKINLDHPNPTQCVGSRFGWLKKYGMMEAKIEEGETHWRMNTVGESLIRPKKGMTKAFKEALANMSEAERLAVTEILSAQVAKDSRKIGRTTAHMSKRAWNYSMGKWRDPSMAPQRA